jgi:hypothetical protein
MKNEKFNFISKLHLAASNDELRPLMSCIHFLNDNAYVSNSHVVIKQHLDYSGVLDSEKLNGKSLHKDSYKEILSYQIVTAKDEGLECVDKEGRKTFFNYQNIEGKIPDFESLFNNHEINPVEFIGFKPSLLKIICDGMYGAKEFGVKAVFNGHSKGIIVTVPAYEQQSALLMPMLINEQLF